MNCHRQSADTSSAPSNGAHVRDKTNIAREWLGWFVLFVVIEGGLYVLEGRVSDDVRIALSAAAILAYVGCAARLIYRWRGEPRHD
ncbi:MAG: hypothetical protein ACPHN2_08805 [Sinimarinibacterium flocculans]|uniref:hypothetical protein n=1 Tax=Sinimarinibacterium flocculans TaxID=985250 RepID=UPI003C3ABB04